MKYKTKVQYLLVVSFQIISFFLIYFIGYASYSLAFGGLEVKGKFGFMMPNEVYYSDVPLQDIKEPLSFRILQYAFGHPLCSSIYTHLVVSALWMVLFDMTHTILEKMKVTKMFQFGIL